MGFWDKINPFSQKKPPNGSEDRKPQQPPPSPALGGISGRVPPATRTGKETGEGPRLRTGIPSGSGYNSGYSVSAGSRNAEPNSRLPLGMRGVGDWVSDFIAAQFKPEMTRLSKEVDRLNDDIRELRALRDELRMELRQLKLEKPHDRATRAAMQAVARRVQDKRPHT